MAKIASSIDSASAGIRGQPRRHAGAGDGSARRCSQRNAAGRQRSGARQAPRGRQAPGARAGGRAARSRLAVPRAVGARGARACTTMTCRARGWSPASAGSAGARVHGRRQRSDREGRHLLPAHRQEASARPGDRRRERAAVHLSGGERRRVPAEAGRGVPRPRAFRAHLLQPGATCRRRASRRSRWCTAPAPRAAPTCPPCPISVIVRNQGRVFLGGPPLVRAATGEEIDAESLGGADVHCRRSGVTDYYAENDTHALGVCAPRGGAPASRPPVALARARLAPSPTTIRAELYGIIPPSSRKPYDVREIIARLVDRLVVRRVQGALRHDAGLRLRRHPRHARSASSPTTASCSPRAR